MMQSVILSSSDTSSVMYRKPGVWSMKDFKNSRNLSYLALLLSGIATGGQRGHLPPFFSGKIVVSLAIHYSYSGLVSSEYYFRFLTIEGAFFITTHLSAASLLRVSRHCHTPHMHALNNTVRSE